MPATPRPSCTHWYRSRIRPARAQSVGDDGPRDVDRALEIHVGVGRRPLGFGERRRRQTPAIVRDSASRRRRRRGSTIPARSPMLRSRRDASRPRKFRSGASGQVVYILFRIVASGLYHWPGGDSRRRDAGRDEWRNQPKLGVASASPPRRCSRPRWRARRPEQSRSKAGATTTPTSGTRRSFPPSTSIIPTSRSSSRPPRRPNITPRSMRASPAAPPATSSPAGRSTSRSSCYKKKNLVSLNDLPA